MGLVGDIISDGEICLVLEDQGRGNSSSGCRGRPFPLSDEFPGPDIVDDGLSIAEQGHCKEDEEGRTGV